MKPGSLVVVKKLPPVPVSNKKYIKWLPIDDEETIYTIRDMDSNSAIFEEGIIGYGPEGDECSLCLEYLREVQSPGEICIEQLLEQSNTVYA